MISCDSHLSEPAEGACGTCARSFCERCLVQMPRRRRALCMSCALQAAGVKAPLRYRRLTWRERRNRRKAVRQAVATARERDAARREHVTAAGLRELYYKPGRALDLDRAERAEPTVEPATEEAVEPVVEEILVEEIVVEEPVVEEALSVRPRLALVIDLSEQVERASVADHRHQVPMRIARG